MACNQRTSVLFVVSDLTGGGAERFTSIVLAALDRRRFEPHLCLWRDRITYPLPPDVPVHSIQKRKWWHLLRTIRRTRRLVEEAKPDIVFTHPIYVSLLTGEALRLARHRPGWVSRITTDPARGFTRLHKLWLARVLPRADVLLCGSAGVARAMARTFRVAPGKVKVLHNPVDVQSVATAAEQEPPQVGLAPDRPVVVAAGRLCPAKAYDDLLHAFALLRRHHDAQLLILGRGPLETELLALAQRLGLSGDVVWAGFQDNPFGFYGKADAFVLTSRFEGFPNALLEAMACGRACVATRCPHGPAEIIEDGRSGLLVDVGDRQAIAAAIGKLLSDRAGREELGRNARARVERMCDVRIQTRRLEAILAGLQAARRRIEGRGDEQVRTHRSASLLGCGR